MSRKLLFVGSSTDLDRMRDLQKDPEVVHSYDYVSWRAKGPLEGLIWKEARKVMVRAKLSDLQAAVIEAHLRGYNDSQIATRLERIDGTSRTRQTIRQIRITANRQLSAIPNLGILTVLYELFGKQPVNELRADRFEANLRKNCTVNILCSKPQELTVSPIK